LILEAQQVRLRSLLVSEQPPSWQRFSWLQFSWLPLEQALLLLDLETYPSTCAQQVPQQLMMQN
jgi:hypothetical protein